MGRRRAATGIRRTVEATSKHRAFSQAPALAGDNAQAGSSPPTTSAPIVAPMPRVSFDGTAPSNIEPAVSPIKPEDVVVTVTLVRGGITNVRVPVAIAGRYDGLPVAGSSKAFDRLLDSWLTRAIDMGIIGSDLGQLFPVNLQAYHALSKLNAAHLLLAGMGEPGCFARDDLRLLSCNVTVAVKGMGYDQFATPLLGTRRNEIPIRDAIGGVLEGILDGYERFCAIANSVSDQKARLRQAAQRPLSLVLVDSDEKKLQEMQNALESIGREGALRTLKLLEVVRGGEVPPDSITDSGDADVEQETPVTLLRVARAQPGVAAAAPGLETELFQFSAMSERAAVPVREQEVNASLLRQLPDRMINAASFRDRQRCSTFFANLIIPDDFIKLTESAGDLTLEVDETTASYPWEMIAHKKYSRTSFMGTNACVSRQFRSLLSPPPCSPPTLNKVLKALIIADPAPGLSLPQARQEGCDVLAMLETARRAWRDEYDLRATIRIGFPGDDTLAPVLEQLRSRGSWVESVEPCDPLELAMLIVNEQYDVIHYAGHAFFDKTANKAGWIFAPNCYLTAKEIFRVRQVPRLVFANACFSAVVADQKEVRNQLAGLAQAFFALGIPNFIGTGWPVDDTCARICARWFYARVLGLRTPDDIGKSAPATIGEALRDARQKALECNEDSSSWGAYQHYGRASDRLVALPNPDAPAQANVVPAADNPFTASTQTLSPSNAGVAKMPINAGAAAATTATADTNLVYVNGIDIDSGKYAFAPRSIDDLAKHVLVHPSVRGFAEWHVERPRSFGVRFGMDPAKLEEAGWAIVVHEDTPQDVRGALEPLIKLREQQAGNRFKTLDYKKGEQTRAWYQRHHISAGNLDPEIVPYYLLLVGAPDLIPFDFQYLLGVEYAVGRLAFDAAGDYERYARSIVDYERANRIPNAKEIAFWGTRHLGDPATNLSASFLIDPLANGVAQALGALKRPIHADVGYERTLHLGDDATKESLLANLHAAKPPAMLFTASHGMAMRSGHPKQLTDQGALLCQDWPGFGTMRPQNYLAAADIADDANVKGTVAFLFACFGDGTPDADQFPMDLSQADAVPPLAPKPFIAALPRRLLAHPNGSALAVIGHIDRAWSFSMQASNVPEAQIGTFRNTLGFVLTGDPVGNAIRGQFGARFAALSTALASATSPVAPTAMHLSDRDLVSFWLERNDAQNYVVLGDPAVRIRTDVFA